MTPEDKSAFLIFDKLEGLERSGRIKDEIIELLCQRLRVVGEENNPSEGTPQGS